MAAASSSSDSSRKRAADDSVEYVPRLENVIINVRDAGGGGKTTREFLLVFPGLLTNTRCEAVMRMVEHQLKQKMQRLLSQQAAQQSDTRLVLAGAGLTIVQDVGGHFESATDEDGEETAVYVPEDGATLSTLAASSILGPADMNAEPVQWKQFGGFSGLYNLLDGSLIDEHWMLNRPGKGLEDRDLRAMTGYKYALLEAQVFLHERLWQAFEAAPRPDNKALKVAVRAVGEGVSTGALASPVDMAVRVLAHGVPDELKPHTARVLADIDAAVEGVAQELGSEPEAEALRAALVARLHTLKRTVHFKTFHPDRAGRVGLGVEQATTMAAWLEEVYSYILKRRLGDGGAAASEAEVVVERAA